MMSQALHEKNAILRLRILLLREQSSDGSGDSTAPIASLRVKCLEAESLGHQSLENPGHLVGEEDKCLMIGKFPESCSPVGC